jgi:Predicted transcriptional regulators containing the CopG/Arc/MetJ DNA-binding domain and a metal-binding domain
MIMRFSISMDAQLLGQLDEYLIRRKYSSRSKAIRDLVRSVLVDEEWERDSEVVGVITLVYNHHQPFLQEKITKLQHANHHQIISTTHVHMDHENCLEVTIVKGRASKVRALAEQLIALRGVKNGNLTMSSTGDCLH